MFNKRIGVIGASGLVGREFLNLLLERGWPAGQIAAFSSDRTAGAEIEYENARLVLRPVTRETVRDIGWFVMAAGESASRQYAPILLAQGAVVVDNSSAWRMEPSVPLVIPEINGHLLNGAPRLVANPNCSTIILLLALNPLRARFGLQSVRVTTFQAVSGAGGPAIDELREQTQADLDGRSVPPAVFPVTPAFNVFCHESPLEAESGLCGEESKMIRESQRIWQDVGAPTVAPFCMRVPVIRAHSQVISARLERPASLAEVRNELACGEGLELVDDRDRGCFPTPRQATGRDSVLVGRVRPSFPDSCDTNGRTRDWSILACGDQLRKGAALNALQILQRLGAGISEGAHTNELAAIGKW